MPCKSAAIREQIQNPTPTALKKNCILLALWLFCFPLSAQDRKKVWVGQCVADHESGRKSRATLHDPHHLNPLQATALANKTKLLGVGGLYITKGGPVNEARLVNRLQAIVKVPLLVGIDAGNGLGQTLDSTATFLNPMALGAIRDDSLVYRVGERIADEMKMLGLHVNFAPHLDAEGGDGPYENYFSDQYRRVAEKCVRFVRGLQDRGVIACAVQFPATLTPALLPDSILFAESTRPDTTGLYTATQLIRNGIGGLATTRFNFTVLENKKTVPAALSSVFVSDLLKNKIGFQGVAFARINELEKIAGKSKKNGDAEWLAFIAGNDMLISAEPGASIKKMIKAVGKNKIRMEQLTESVRRILMAKYDAGLSVYRPVNLDNLVNRLHPPENDLLHELLAEASVTVVNNGHQAIPVQTLEGKKFASIAVGTDAVNEFARYLTKYADVKLSSVRSLKDTVGLEKRLEQADVVIVSVFPGTPFFPELISLIRNLSTTKEVILCDFGNPRKCRRSRISPR